jgi:hypothetical protein
MTRLLQAVLWSQEARLRALDHSSRMVVGVTPSGHDSGITGVGEGVNGLQKQSGRVGDERMPRLSGIEPCRRTRNLAIL